MTKTEIIQLFGNARGVARFFGISDAAVSEWEIVPELRQLQLEMRRPDLYRKYSRNRAKARREKSA